MNWIDASLLRDVPRHLVGVLELPPRPHAPALELHVHAFDDGGPTLGLWLDERGRPWRFVHAARA